MLGEVNTGWSGAADPAWAVEGGPWVMAQGASGKDSTALIIAVVALIAAVAVLGSIVLVVRKRAFRAERERGGAAGLMEQLRQLHREGKLSDDEFAAVIAKMKQKIRSEAGLNASGGAKPARENGGAAGGEGGTGGRERRGE